MRSLLTSILALFMLLTIMSFQKADRSTDKLTIISAAFTQGGMIPFRYTCEGDNVNPPLQIGGIPDTARSLALIVFEPDVKRQTDYIHWIAWDLPLSGNIPENYKSDKQGINGNRKYGYTGMCPIAEGVHHFYFRAYALDTVLSIKKDITKAEFETAIKGHVISQGELRGDFAQGEVTIPTKTSVITTVPLNTNNTVKTGSPTKQ